MFSVILFTFVILVNLALLTVAIRLGTRWAKIDRRSWQRCVVAAIAMCVLGAVAGAIGSMNPILTHPRATSGQVGFFLLVTALMQCAGMIAGLFWALRASLKQSLQVWLVSLIASGVILAIVLGVVRPFLSEGYTSPTMNMVPTLRPAWTTGVCPSCAGETVVSIQDGFYVPQSSFVCTKCYACDTLKKPATEAQSSGDRFVVNKLRTPGRWDIAAFRTVRDPSVMYVKRLVGLPGETIQLMDGKLLINGAPITPPPHCAAIRFGEIRGSVPMKTVGIDAPLQLGPGEYFMLGDNQMMSLDSRFEGPVPAANLVGVAEWIYWPPARFGLLP